MAGKAYERHTITRKALHDLQAYGLDYSGYIFADYINYVVVCKTAWTVRLLPIYCVNEIEAMGKAETLAALKGSYVELWQIVDCDVFSLRYDWLMEHEDLTPYEVRNGLACETAYMIWPYWRNDSIMVILNDYDHGVYMPADVQGMSPHVTDQVCEWDWQCVGYCDGGFPQDAQYLPEFEPWLPLDMLPAEHKTHVCQCPNDVIKELEACHA